MNARNKHSNLAWLGAAVLVLSCFSGIASAQTRTHPAIVVAVGDPSCLAGLKTQCLLRTSRRYFEMKLSEAGQMMAVFRAAAVASPNRPDSGSGEGGAVANGAPLADVPPLGRDALPPVTLQIRSDLEAEVQAGQMTLDDANKILSDVASLDGMIYQVPSLEKIETDLGLPGGEVPAGSQDLQDLICAHLQVTLGVGPQTAVYLSTRLGIERLEPVDLDIAGNPAPNPSQTAPELANEPGTQAAAEPAPQISEADAQFSLPNRN